MRPDGNVMDRLPPHNRDAERSLLGSMLRDNNVIPEAVNLVRADNFYVYAHQLIFEAIAKLNDDQGKAADIVTVAEYLMQHKQLEEIGGMAYLAELWDAAPSAAHFRHYAEIIRQKAIVRSLITTCNELQADAYDQSQPPSELLDSAERRILEIAEMGITGDTITLEVALKEAYDRLDARKQRGDNQLSGIATGFVDLDNLTAGFQNSDLVILAARPSVGKCLAWDSEIVLEDGSVGTIQDIYRRQQARLLTLGGDWRFQLTSPSAFVDDGIKEVYRVTTRLGRSIETTASHPFLTIDGWRPLAEIKAGESIAVPRRLAIFGRETMRECEVKLLAYFIGDGCLTDTSPEFTNTNPTIQADFEEAIQAFGVVKTRREDGNGTRAMTFCISSDLDVIARNRQEFGERLRTLRTAQGRPARRIAQSLNVSPGLVCMWEKGQCAPAEQELTALCALLETESEELVPGGLISISKNGKNALARWLDELGLWGKGAREKFVPAVVFRLPPTQLAVFLNRMFATDGWATVTTAGAPQLGYCSVSERLIRQIQHLLLRFGIVASIRKRGVKYREQQRTAWQLDITNQQAIRVFVEMIGIFGKDEAVRRVLEALEGRNHQTNCDLIPRAIWERLTLAKGTDSWRTVARRMGYEAERMNLHVGKRDLSRQRLRDIASAVGAQDLVSLSESEVYWDRIVSIEPVGLKQVYDLTIPDTHNFVANDICVHNTAYALNIARHVVVEEQLPVLFVSLEQARVELAERLLCCQARVDSHRLRRGHLTAEDMQKIFEAGDILSNSKLFIDDTPGQNMLRISANARRLKKKHNLRLVIIDYLQLIDPDDRRDSRQEQVAGISRRLKFLARELKVPVVALAQVNRSSEDRQDHKPRLSDLRECVTGDTLVVLNDGRRTPIRELVGTCPEVLAMTPQGRIISAVANKIWSVGKKPIFQVRLASGRTIRATGRHRFFCLDGWIRLENLGPGDRIAVARQIPEPNQCLKWSEDELVLLGHLVGDGSYLVGQPLRYTTCSEENSEIVVAAAKKFGAKVTRYAGRGNWHQLLISGNGNRWQPAGVNRWLRDLGIFGQRSHEKHLPTGVFQLKNDQVAILLRHLWATDGCIHVRASHQRGTDRIYFATNSRSLAQDVSALLLRLGVTSRFRTSKQGCYRDLYTVDVSGLSNQRIFLTTVGGFGPRQGAAEALINKLAERGSNPNVDTIPQEVFSRVKERMGEQGISWRRMAALRGTSFGGSSHFSFAPSRETLAEYADLLDDPSLAELATNDLFWDRVVAIEPAGEEEVFDLTVPGPSSWLADGIVSHNSGAIEQDADTVLMLHRPDYHEAGQHEGLVEVIVAKQRNGPTGEVSLLYVKQFMRFENFAVEHSNTFGGGGN